MLLPLAAGDPHYLMTYQGVRRAMTCWKPGRMTSSNCAMQQALVDLSNDWPCRQWTGKGQER